MNEVYEKLLKCYACFEDKIDFKPQAASMIRRSILLRLFSSLESLFI